MTFTSFDWSRIIAEMKDDCFGIPTDVTFQIEENGQVHEVKAHKMIMGMVSPMLKTMFYATNVGDKTAKVIKVEKTTVPAFEIMMDAVYNVKSIEASLKGKSVHEVFDVMILVERYQIMELIEAVKDEVTDYPITDDTVLEVAAEAKEYTRMFEAEAQQILRTCAKFLNSKLKDDDAMTRYAAENKDQAEIFADLRALICANCKKVSCQDGEAVKDHEFRVGLLVAYNKASSHRNMSNYGTGRVTNVESANVSVENVKPGIFHKYDGGSYYKTNLDGISKFLFSCGGVGLSAGGGGGGGTGTGGAGAGGGGGDPHATERLILLNQASTVVPGVLVRNFGIGLGARV